MSFLAALLVAFWPRHAGAQPSATGRTSDADVAAGQVEQWRTELGELGATNTAATDAAISGWLDRLLAGQVAKEIQLDVLEAAGKHNAPAIKEKLARYQAARLQEGGLATCSELLYGGNAERGKKIFFEKTKAICIKCHKVGRDGGESGPPLTDTTTNRTREFILESILVPSAKITPGYETFSVVLKDRTGYRGVIKQESETSLTIDCPPDEDFLEERLVTIQKADIAARRKCGSAMPDGMDKALSPRELRDLIEFVAGLKREGSSPESGLAAAPGQPKRELVQGNR